MRLEEMRGRENLYDTECERARACFESQDDYLCWRLDRSQQAPHGPESDPGCNDRYFAVN